MSCTRSLLDLGQKGNSDKPKIAKNGQMEHVERTRNQLMMCGQNERYESLYTSARKTLVWHGFMMHATLCKEIGRAHV